MLELLASIEGLILGAPLQIPIACGCYVLGRRRKQLSTRDLLLFVTLEAVGLGLFVWYIEYGHIVFPVYEH